MSQSKSKIKTRATNFHSEDKVYRGPERHRVTVVVPVYGDWPSLKDCIKSLELHLNKRYKVLLVNDNGPEADYMEKEIKKAIKGIENFEYKRNSKNLGFLKTCNRTVFELDRSNNDILLLNSDTKVTAGFLEEMLSVLYSNNKIAAVTPRSNNATIATIPISAMSQKGIEPEKSYELFEKLRTRLPRYSEVPTAHGFCMLIRRTVIKKYGLFDEVFGMGYGEEVDFCMRIQKQGYKCVLANRAYVFHLEARSFTHERKAQLLAISGPIITKRYPEYKQLITSYIGKALREEEGMATMGKIINKSLIRGRLQELKKWFKKES